MVTFKTAPTVAAGDKITSADWNGLAEAVNDRLKSGVGDPTFRLWYKVFSLGRSIRTTPDGITYPANDEWLSDYMLVKPGDTAAAVDFEPENDLNPLMAFGKGGYSIDDETRINGLPTAAYVDEVTAWELAKSQRGAFDPETGAEGAPALAAARAHAAIIAANRMALFGSTEWTPFLRNYGGIMPVAPLADVNCTGEPVFDPDIGADIAGPITGPGLRVFFTSLRGAGTVEFASTCKYESDTEIHGGNLKTVEIVDENYVCTTWDGTVTKLPVGDWVIGPFLKDTTLRHTDAQAMEPVLQRFASDFRGTTAARSGDGYRVRGVAFDFDRFFRRQYWLAPALGYEDAEAESGVVAIYPEFTSNAEMEAGTSLPTTNPTAGDLIYTVPHGDQFVVIGVKVTVMGADATLTGLGEENITLEFRDADSVTPLYGSLTVTGDGTRIVMFDEADLRSPIQLEVKTIGRLAAGTTVAVEWAVIEKRKPRLADAYVVLRRGTTTGEGDQLDAIGNTASAKAVGEAYFAHRALFNDAAVPIQAQLELNPVYETARAMIQERMRLMKRPALKGYAVEDGNSVLWFDRFVTISGEQFDAWWGIAPPVDSDGNDVEVASGSIQANVVYRAVGAVTYNGVEHADGETFSGVDGVTDYTGGSVVQHEGIIGTAARKGLTNEWVMFLSSTVYNDSEGSSYKPENYGDIVGMLHNRCMFLSDGIQYTDLCGHLGYPPGCLNPPLTQSATAHNYYAGINALTGETDEDKTNFYRSCQVYPPDYMLGSVTYDAETGEVRVQLAGRLRNCSADTSIARADGPNACSGEDYRTDENILRQYLYHAAGSGQCAPLPGDAAELLSPAGDGAWGSCHPRFYLTRLVPRVAVDYPVDNSVQESARDTRVLAHERQWMAFVLDAMCEGYLDVQAGNTAPQCPTRPAQYTIENLWVQAGGAQSFCLMPDAARADRPMGYGPYANQVIYAEEFNRLARALNLLTFAPIELPWQFERRKRTWNNRQAFGLSVVNNEFPPPDSGTWFANAVVYGDVSGIDPESNESVTDWADGMDLEAGAEGHIAHLDVCEDAFVRVDTGSGWSFAVDSSQYCWETRLKADQLAFEAVPVSLQDNVHSDFVLLATMQHKESWNEYDADGSQPPNCGPILNAPWDAPEVNNVGHNTENTHCMIIAMSDGQIITMHDYLHQPAVLHDSFLFSYNTNAHNGAGGCIALCTFGIVTHNIYLQPYGFTAAVRIPLV